MLMETTPPGGVDLRPPAVRKAVILSPCGKGLGAPPGPVGSVKRHF
jgi:hypothetical protein